MSTLGDLTSRVRRFGKSTNSVPGTYMSAAGVQTEIHPTTLARLAVHETLYRRQVHVYRQDLESCVHKIRKDQILLKRSYGEYKRKLNQNQKNKYVGPFYSPSGELNCTLSSSSDVVKGKVKIVNRGGKKVKIFLPPLEKNHSEGAIESTVVQEVSENKAEVVPSNVKMAEDPSKPSKERLHSKSLNLHSNYEGDAGSSEQSNQATLEDQESGLQQLGSKSQESLENVGSGSRIKTKRSKKKLKVNKSDIEKTSLTTKTPEGNPTKSTDGNRATEDFEVATTKEDKENTGFVTDKDSVMVVLQKARDRGKSKASKKTVSDTSTFMELVRMKNKTGLTKNMKVVDELIQHSKSRSFAYLTKVSEKSQEEKEWAEPHERASQESHELHKHSPVFQQVTNAILDDVDGETDDIIALSEIISLDGSTPKLGNDVPRRSRKPSSILVPENDKLSYVHRDGTNYSLFASRNPNQLLPGRSQPNEVPISMRVSLPPRKVDKFLKDEKVKSSNYKSDVSWQQSLASIRDVHYLRNNDDFQSFAKSVIKDKKQ